MDNLCFLFSVISSLLGSPCFSSKCMVYCNVVPLLSLLILLLHACRGCVDHHIICCVYNQVDTRKLIYDYAKGNNNPCPVRAPACYDIE